MNIAILGWADPSKGASQGGGYNLITEQHLLYLKEQGHSVFHLRSGLDYSIINIFSQKVKPKIRKDKTWKNIKLFRLWNSNNFAPADRNGSQYKYQLSSSVQDLVVLEWLDKYKIKSIFIHSLEGQSLSLIPLLKQGGRTVSVFCHDHYYICPRVSLLYENQICSDNDKGNQCISCLRDTNDSSYPKKRFIKSLFPKLTIKNKAESTKTTINKYINNSAIIQSRNKGQNDSLWGKRNKFSTQVLCEVNHIYSPSNFIADTLISSGVNTKNIQVAKIGLPHLDHLKMQPESGPDDGRVHFAFRGGSEYRKGGAVLLEALKKMDKSYRKRSCIHIWGLPLPSNFLEKEWIKSYLSYKTVELVSHIPIYHIGILSHLWYENSPVALLEHLASGKPVLSPRLGGVEDYIEENINGWYFHPGDSESLLMKLYEIIDLQVLPVIDKNKVNTKEAFFQSLKYK